MTYDVFLSHSSKDKAVTDAVCHYLESQGIRCWVAPRDVRLGESYATQIVRAISASRAVTLIFSDNANQSTAVQNELECAFSHGIPIFPLRVEDVPFSESLEFYLGATHWLDAFSPEERHFEQLAAALKRHFGQTSGQAASQAPPSRPPLPPTAVVNTPPVALDANAGPPTRARSTAPPKRPVRRPPTPHTTYLLTAIVSGLILAMIMVGAGGYWLHKNTQLAKAKATPDRVQEETRAVARGTARAESQTPAAATAAPAKPTPMTVAAATPTPSSATPVPSPSPAPTPSPSPVVAAATPTPIPATPIPTVSAPVASPVVVASTTPTPPPTPATPAPTVSAPVASPVVVAAATPTPTPAAVKPAATVTPKPSPTKIAEPLPNGYGVFAMVNKKPVSLEKDPICRLSVSIDPEFIAYDKLVASSGQDWTILGMEPDLEIGHWRKLDTPTTACRTQQIDGQPEMIRLHSPEPLTPGLYCLKGAGKEAYFAVEIDQLKRDAVQQASAALKDSIVSDEGLQAIKSAATLDDKNPRWRNAWQVLAAPRLVPNPSGALTDLRFSPNGTQLLGRSQSVLTWKMPEAKPQTCVEANRNCLFSGMTVTGDGKLLIAGTLDNRICLWDGTTGAKICDLQESNNVRNVRFANETVVGDLFASAKDKKPENTLIVRSWSTDGKLIGGHDLPNWTEGLRLQPLVPSGVLAYACRQVAHVLDVSAGKVIADVPKDLSVLAVGCKGEYLVQPDGKNTLELWEPGSAAARITCQGMSKKPDAAVISPDSKRVVATCANEETGIWDTTTGKRIGSYPAGGAIQFSDDSSLFAQVQSDQVVIHNAQTGTVLRSLPGPRQSCFAFDPSLQWAISAAGAEVRLWRLRGFPNPGDLEAVQALKSTAGGPFEKKLAEASAPKQNPSRTAERAPVRTVTRAQAPSRQAPPQQAGPQPRAAAAAVAARLARTSGNNSDAAQAVGGLIQQLAGPQQ